MQQRLVVTSPGNSNFIYCSLVVNVGATIDTGTTKVRATIDTGTTKVGATIDTGTTNGH